jgi:hypothetical protein
MRNDKHRSRVWNLRNPDNMEDVTAIFGQPNPTTGVVAAWKTAWYNSTKNTFKLELGANYKRGNIGKICNQCGIHPYLWDTFTDADGNKLISFYYEEHLVMFTLTWQE